MLKLHLGCGPHIKPGFDNLDLEPGPGGIKYDLRKPLTYATGTVDFIYTEHFIEHLTKDEGTRFLEECFRVLKPDGFLRVVTPDLKILTNDYTQNKLNRWEQVWRPSSACDLLNEGMRLWGHMYLYDEKELRRSIRKAGFDPQYISDAPHGRSFLIKETDLEVRPYHNDLILEAIK